jgi:hypothetical protein
VKARNKPNKVAADNALHSDHDLGVVSKMQRIWERKVALEKGKDDDLARIARIWSAHGFVRRHWSYDLRSRLER